MDVVNNKSQILSSIGKYENYFDDDIVRHKKAVREKLTSNAQLLYALNNPDLMPLLFVDYDKNNFTGNTEINFDNSPWDDYYGINIIPFRLFPTQNQSNNFICYTVSTVAISDSQYNFNLTFDIVCDDKTILLNTMGIPRHDLISAILREMFDNGNVLDIKCKLVSSTEAAFEDNYIVRTMVFESTKPIQRLTNNVVTNFQVKR